MLVGDVSESNHNWTGKCPRCGGSLPLNSGDGIRSVMFAASPSEELCERCLNGHEPGWLEYPSGADWWLGRRIQRSRFLKWLMSGRSD